MPRYYIIRKTDSDEGAMVEVSQDTFIRVGQTVAEEIKRGRAHFVKQGGKKDQPGK